MQIKIDLHTNFWGSRNFAMNITRQWRRRIVISRVRTTVDWAWLKNTNEMLNIFEIYFSGKNILDTPCYKQLFQRIFFMSYENFHFLIVVWKCLPHLNSLKSGLGFKFWIMKSVCITQHHQNHLYNTMSIKLFLKLFWFGSTFRKCNVATFFIQSYHLVYNFSLQVLLHAVYYNYSYSFS